MKKISIFLLLLIPFSACTGKLGEDKGEDIDPSGYTIFQVDTESLQIAGSDVAGAWKNGDRIGVFGSEKGENVPYYLKKSGDGLQAAAFYGGVVKGDVQAYFPYEEGVVAGSGTIPCELETVQAFDPDAAPAEYFLKYNPRTFASLGADGMLHFRYPMGMLDVTIGFDDPITVKGMVLNSSAGISGRLDVDKDGNVVDSGLAHKYITMSLGDTPVPSRAGDSFAHFFFVLPPKSYGAGELSLVVSSEEEDDIHIVIRDLVVQRVESSDFPVTSIVVGTSDIPSYDKENGYFE